MNAKLVNSAAGVIMAALQQNRTAAGIALALDSAGLLASPEMAAELEQGRLRVDEVERKYIFDTAELKRQLESARVDGARLIRAEQRRAELEAVLDTHRKDDQAEIERLRAQVAELEAERHSTNEALADITVAERSADRLTALFAPTQVLREESYAEAVSPRVQAMRALLDGQRAAVEDPHDGPLHHSYRVPRDLPETGGAR